MVNIYRHIFICTHRCETRCSMERARSSSSGSPLLIAPWCRDYTDFTQSSKASSNPIEFQKRSREAVKFHAEMIAFSIFSPGNQVFICCFVETILVVFWHHLGEAFSFKIPRYFSPRKPRILGGHPTQHPQQTKHIQLA